MSLCFYSYDVHSQTTPEDLIRLSRKYYMSQKIFSIEVNTRFKSMIIIDTLSTFTDCYINKASNVMIFKSNDNVHGRIGSDEYSVYNYQGSSVYAKTKERSKKQSLYESKFRNLPFTDSERFFDIFQKKINWQSKISETDSMYLIQSSSVILVFRKKDYSIKSITEFVYDRMHKGFQFSQYLFGAIHAIDSSARKDIEYYLSVVNDPSRDVNRKGREPMPDSIDVALLEKKLEKTINGEIMSFKNKIIVLDFFYQGCLPCVKSYPYVNSLFSTKSSNLLVIGVDQLINDTLTIDKYIKRYNLLYPILIGESAVFLTQYFKLHSFPAFIIIDPNGMILKYGNGFTRSSFKKLKNYIQHKRK